MTKKKTARKTKKQVEVKIEIPIHSFGFFTFKEFKPETKRVTKTRSTPIYVFPESTAAIAQV